LINLIVRFWFWLFGILDVGLYWPLELFLFVTLYIFDCREFTLVIEGGIHCGRRWPSVTISRFVIFGFWIWLFWTCNVFEYLVIWICFVLKFGVCAYVVIWICSFLVLNFWIWLFGFVKLDLDLVIWLFVCAFVFWNLEYACGFVWFWNLEYVPMWLFEFVIFLVLNLVIWICKIRFGFGYFNLFVLCICVLNL